MSPSAWALRHPVPVTIITAGAVLFGLLSLFFLNREFIPPMLTPSSTVVSIWPGVGPEDIESNLTSVLEDQFATMPGLSDISSMSREGVSVITLKFSEDTDNNAVLQELRSRVDKAYPELPPDLNGKPEVSSWGASDLPVFTFSVSAPWDADRLGYYVEDVLVPSLYMVDGVAEAEALGIRKKEVHAVLDSFAAGSSNVTAAEVIGLAYGRNRALPAGLVEWDGGEWALRVSGEFQSLSQLRNLAVGKSRAGNVRLGDLADIREVYPHPDVRIRSRKDDIIVVQISKKETGNAIRMSRDIRSGLEMMENSVGGGLRFTVIHDDSETVRMSLNAVIRSALTGIAMAVAILWLFLRNWRFTSIVAVSLPISLVLAFAGMKLAGQSLNILTLTGITVSLGMVVDASIVVLENIHSRRSRGGDTTQAVLDGANSVSSAVIASTSTTLSVFLPMLFLTGIIGNIMRDLSLTIVLCLTSSLFAALMIVPPLARRILSSGKGGGRSGELSRHRGAGRFMTFLENRYRRGLKGSLSMTRTVLGVATAILVVSLLSADMMGLTFLPEADYNELFISLELRPGSNLEDSVAIADKVEALVRDLVPETQEVIFYAGMEDDLAGEARKRDTAWGHIILKPSNRRKRDFRSIIDQLNREIPRSVPGTSVRVLNGGFDRMVAMGVDGSGFRVELSSESPEKLNDAAEQVESILASDPEIIGTFRDVNEDRQFIQARLDANALNRSGIDAYEAAYAARIAFDGADMGTLRVPGEPDRDIRLTTNFDGQTPGSSTLLGIPVRGSDGRILPLDALIDVEVHSGVSGIRRRDRVRTITVVGSVAGENIREIDRRFRTALEAEPLPEGVVWDMKGIGGLIGDSVMDMALVLFISLFLVYAVMAIQFERFIQPLVIMASVPFSFIGVVLGLAVFGSNLSIISFLGIIALGGIVVNNAIIQVDRINQLRLAGMTLDKAVIEGAVGRLRPVLMTTLTTFFGVLPLSLAKGAGARIYAPLGQAIAGGLLTSTLVTLFLVPTVYRLVERRKEVSRDISGTAKIIESGVA